MSSQTSYVGTRIQNSPEISHYGVHVSRESLQPRHSHQRVWIHLESSDIAHLKHRTPKRTAQKSPKLVTDIKQTHKTSWKPTGKHNSNLRHKTDQFLTDHLLVTGITPLHRNHQVCEYTLSDRGFMAWNTHPKELRCFIPFRQLIFSNS